MRILYIHQFFATRESSLGLIRSYEFARRWVAQGHQVTIITSSSRLPEEYSRSRFATGEIDGIQVRSVRVDYSNYMSYARRMLSFAWFTIGATLRALGAGRHDVVFATSTPLTVGIPGWMAAALTGTPFVFEVRDLWPEAAIQMNAFSRTSLLGRATKVLERFLYRRAADVIALSPGMAQGVIDEGVDPSHVHMVPNSSDLDLFNPGPKDQAFVAEHDLGDRFVVGYAGAIGPTNAVELNVPAAAKVLRDRGRNDIVFVIAGDGKRMPTLRSTIEAMELDNIVLVGSLPKRDIPRLVTSSDMVMALFADVPILATNSPNKLFDGLAAGKPVLVNSAGWTKDLLEANGAGVYAPAADGEAMADAIVRLADDSDLRERMGRNARDLAEKRFGRDDLAERVLQVLMHATHPHR